MGRRVSQAADSGAVSCLGASFLTLVKACYSLNPDLGRKEAWEGAPRTPTCPLSSFLGPRQPAALPRRVPKLLAGAPVGGANCLELVLWSCSFSAFLIKILALRAGKDQRID